MALCVTVTLRVNVGGAPDTLVIAGDALEEKASCVDGTLLDEEDSSEVIPRPSAMNPPRCASSVVLDATDEEFWYCRRVAVPFTTDEAATATCAANSRIDLSNIFITKQ